MSATIPLFVALVFCLVVVIGLGGVIAAVSVYAVYRIGQMAEEIAQLKGDFATQIEAAEARCDRRVADGEKSLRDYKAYSEKALNDYSDLLSQFADAAGYRDIARRLAERSGVNITTGGDANIGGDIAGRDVIETDIRPQRAAR